MNSCWFWSPSNTTVLKRLLFPRWICLPDCQRRVEKRKQRTYIWRVHFQNAIHISILEEKFTTWSSSLNVCKIEDPVCKIVRILLSAKMTSFSIKKSTINCFQFCRINYFVREGDFFSFPNGSDIILERNSSYEHQRIRGGVLIHATPGQGRFHLHLDNSIFFCFKYGTKT